MAAVIHLLPQELRADSHTLYTGHRAGVRRNDFWSLFSQPEPLERMGDLELLEFGLSCQFLELSPR